MAENNYFDPIGEADLPTKPTPEQIEIERRRRFGRVDPDNAFIDRPKMIPAGPPPPVYPNIEDRRLADFGDWQNGRWLDPTPFQQMKDVAWRLPPGSYLSSDLPPVPPPNELGRALGSDELDRANAAMVALREGLARRAVQSRKK